MSSQPGTAHDGSDGPSPPYTALSNASSGFNMFAFLPPTSSQGRRDEYESAYPGDSRVQTTRTDTAPTGTAVTLESRDFPVTPPPAVPLENLTAYFGGVPPQTSLPGTASIPMTAPTAPASSAARSVSESPWSRDQVTTSSISQAAPVVSTTESSIRSALQSSGVASLEYRQDSAPPSGVPGQKQGSFTESGSEKDPEKGEAPNDSLPITPPSSAGAQPPSGDDADDTLEDSVYPEVRASVSNIDDKEMPVMTIRAWVIGITLCVVTTGINAFLNLRWPAPVLAPSVVMLIAFPLGKLAALVLPIRYWTIPERLPWIGGMEFSLNPAPFNVKEHTLICIMANIAASTIVVEAAAVTDKRYGYHLNLGMQVLLTVSAKLIGFSLAAFWRNILIIPGSSIWPQNLVISTLLNSLHAEDGGRMGYGMSRRRFFAYVAGGTVLYSFLPGFLFTGLSYFSFVCWIRPNNVVVNQLFGSVTGLGMSFLSFDWSQISWVISPLVVPWWALWQQFLGFVVICWLIVPILYYKNVWKSGHLPIMGSSAYDRFAEPYSLKHVITRDFRLNETAYEEYSPVYLPITYSMTYFFGFAVPIAALVHVILWQGKSIYKVLRGEQAEKPDIHARLMKEYPEISMRWIWVIFILSFAGILGAFGIHNDVLPVWSAFIVILIPIIWFLPVIIIYAMTTQLIPLNLYAQVIPGLIAPGQPIAALMMKAVTLEIIKSGSIFAQDQKLCHYMKVPPRATLLAQTVAATLAVVVQVGVQSLVFKLVPDVCTPNQANQLTCNGLGVHFTSSLVWGLIGPRRLFGKNGIYKFHPYGILIGAILPIALWFWQRRRPNSHFGSLHTPLVLSGPLGIPPATGINYSSWFLVGFVTQYLLRIRKPQWWLKYNYILSSALDTGTIFGIILIFLCLYLPKKATLTLNWWGNTVWQNTADAAGVAYYPTNPDIGF
ncbi:hypothetical protein FS837_001548 [Tulasnella sp. UAMH 9824]|nr:hypothetical protein FS837_001548 [Tulasnella sp. UAMH 9824]